MKKENEVQADIIRMIHNKIPDCIILKNDPKYIQGIPDLSILHKTGRWATLEVKRSQNEHHQPNQDYYVSVMDNMSFSAFIYPENAEQVIDDMAAYLMDGKGGRL